MTSASIFNALAELVRTTKKTISASLFAAGTVLIAASAHGDVLSGPIINPANGHAYYLLTQNVWTASEAEAVTLGGHLATINDTAENAWVYSTFGQFGGVNRNLWIGLYDTDPAVNSTNRATRRLEFAWVSGEPVVYTNWSPVEPNNPISSDPAVPEFYGHIWNPTDPYAGRWNNFRDADTEFSIGLFGVVEVVPEPTTLALLAALTMPARRRR